MSPLPSFDKATGEHVPLKQGKLRKQDNMGSRKHKSQSQKRGGRDSQGDGKRKHRTRLVKNKSRLKHKGL